MKVLITAGPVWAPIDTMRVITNIFGGALGFEITKEARRLGHDVTLLMGPGRVQLPPPTSGLKIVRFKYFNDLLKAVKSELKNTRYDVMIHSAAVSDYVPVNVFKGKIKSGSKHLILHLKPTIKIVNLIKNIRPKIFLVKFKLEVNKKEKELLDAAYRSMKESRADLIVANDYKTVIKDHKAFILDNDRKVIPVVGKKAIAKKLFSLINQGV